jgi:16S rRNA (guanine(966)-N(2))-methyltransferase RsmD
MRVIGGRFRSRKLKTVPGLAVRPTPDRLRETLFNVLAPEIEGVVFLDAYAGSGAVGIEALSRGARHALLFERNAEAVAVIRENLDSLGIAAQATIIRGNALTLLAKHAADIVFLDPPYSRERDYQAALELLAISPLRLAIAQHISQLKLPGSAGALQQVRQIRQGSNVLSFYRPTSER